MKGDVTYINSTYVELGRSALPFNSAKEKGQVGRSDKSVAFNCRHVAGPVIQYIVQLSAELLHTVSSDSVL